MGQNAHATWQCCKVFWVPAIWHFSSGHKATVMAVGCSHPAEHYEWLASISLPEEQIRLQQETKAGSPLCELFSAISFTESLFEVKSNVMEACKGADTHRRIPKHVTYLYRLAHTHMHASMHSHTHICGGIYECGNSEQIKTSWLHVNNGCLSTAK